MACDLASWHWPLIMTKLWPQRFVPHAHALQDPSLLQPSSRSHGPPNAVQNWQVPFGACGTRAKRHTPAGHAGGRLACRWQRLAHASPGTGRAQRRISRTACSPHRSRCTPRWSTAQRMCKQQVGPPGTTSSGVRSASGAPACGGCAMLTGTQRLGVAELRPNLAGQEVQDPSFASHVRQPELHLGSAAVSTEAPCMEIWRKRSGSGGHWHPSEQSGCAWASQEGRQAEGWPAEGMVAGRAHGGRCPADPGGEQLSQASESATCCSPAWILHTCTCTARVWVALWVEAATARACP